MNPGKNRSLSRAEIEKMSRKKSTKLGRCPILSGAFREIRERLNNVTRQLYSNNLVRPFTGEPEDEAHVYAALCNRDYEGEIKQAGDTVKINAIGRVSIGSYTKNTDIDELNPDRCAKYAGHR